MTEEPGVTLEHFWFVPQTITQHKTKSHRKRCPKRLKNDSSILHVERINIHMKMLQKESN